MVLDDYLEDGLRLLEIEYPDSFQKVEAAQERLANGNDSASWQAAGLHCRDAILEFSHEAFSPDFVPDGTPIPKRNDAASRIELTLRHFGKYGGSEALRALVRKSFAYTMEVQHKVTATKEEAERATLHAVIALSELARLLRDATQGLRFMELYGVYKCRACHSTELVEDADVETDSDGQMSGSPYLECSNCGWSAGRR